MNKYPLVKAAPVIRIAQPAQARQPRLTRYARVYIVGILAMALTYFGYGLGALVILGFWAILGAATRRYDDTTDRVYMVGGMRLYGDTQFDKRYEEDEQ